MAPTSIRIPKNLEERIRELAADERRTFSNMVIVLLEQALDHDHEPITQEIGVPGVVTMRATSTKRAQRAQDYPHFKPDFK